MWKFLSLSTYKQRYGTSISVTFEASVVFIAPYLQETLWHLDMGGKKPGHVCGSLRFSCK